MNNTGVWISHAIFASCFPRAKGLVSIPSSLFPSSLSFHESCPAGTGPWS